MSLFGSIFGEDKSTTNPSTVWGGQTPYLQGLYQRAYNASLGLGSGGQAIMPGGQQQGGGGRGGIVTGPGGFRRWVGGRADTQPAPGQPGSGQLQDPLQALGGNLTQQGLGMLGNLGMLGQAGNPFAQAQIGQLGQGLGRLFQQQIMPGITSTFAGAGQLGGDRQALALGQAGEGLGQAFSSGALDILGNSAQLALGANQAGLGGLGQVFGAGNGAVFGSLPGLAGLIGNPTVLGGGGNTYGTPGILGGLGALFGGG